MHIEITHAHKTFDGVMALDDVTLGVEAGERVALTGPNGSGKSTLVRALMGLVPCAGIRIDGRDAFTARAVLARDLAYVPQIAPNLTAPVDEVVAAIAALRGIARDDVAAVADALALPLAEVGARPVRALSGGMKQKLLIALALASPASLVVLDEPTASLDRASREAFFALIEARAPHATLVLGTHRTDEIRRLADRVITLETGRVVSDEPASQWLAGRDGGQACA
jgi:ABC-type multidrug transport system ATPase subunit